jgi:BMFP domain-containing protein YqiC
LEEAKDAQSSVLANTKGRIAEVEAKLIAVEERINKGICDVKIDKQIESVNASAGKSGSYEKLKAKCRKLEERLLNVEQNTTMGKSMYRLLDSNMKYTRELNDGVNSWKNKARRSTWTTSFFKSK